MSNLILELGKEKPTEICKCCGGKIFTAFGFISRNGSAYSVYRATWAPSHPEAGISISLKFGSWNEAATDEDRFQIGLVARTLNNQIEFSFIDPKDSPWATPHNAKMITREEALMHTDRADFFHVAEHVVKDDPRIANALAGV